MNPTLAGNWVTRVGDIVQRARLLYIFRGDPPPPEAVRELLAGQRPDGGWQSFWAPSYSSIDTTCYRLAQAEQLGLAADDPTIVRALRFLVERQQADGAWEEEPGLSSMAPPWAMPGSREARLYLTANSGYWLARLSPSGMGSLRESARRAAGVLLPYLSGRDHLPSFLQADWLAAGMWQCLGRTDLANRIYGFLETRVPEMGASHLAWLILALVGAGLPPIHSVLAPAAARLAGLQLEDGHWPSDESPSRDIDTTIDAVYALKRVGRW